jgi:hypothetical protein
MIALQPAAVVLAVLFAAAPKSPAPQKPPAQAKPPAQGKAPAAPKPLEEDRAYALAREAFTFGFPLVVTDLTREQLTRVPKPSGARGAPVNQFSHLFEFPNARFDGQRTPNADTLYSSAFLDLGKEPIVLTVPEHKDRYYVLSIFDAWTNVLTAPGVRTTGSAGGHYALVGPGWKGTFPADVIPINVPTTQVWVIGRTFLKGREDLEAGRAAQAGLRLTPLSAWGKAYKPPAGPSKASRSNAAPNDEVRDLGAKFFVRFAEIMRQGNLPSPADLPVVRRLSELGLVPGQPFPLDSFAGPTRAALERAVQDEWKELQSGASKDVHKVNGWSVPDSDTGDYETDYALRARTAFHNLGTSLVEDELALRAIADSEGAPLDGSRRYILRVPKEAAPPVNGFWSVTIYDARNLFFDNPLERYRLGDRDALKRNPDGSVDLYLGAVTPGPEREPNWLPIPAQGPFSVILRLYWPKQAALDGTWKPPPLLHAQ